MQCNFCGAHESDIRTVGKCQHCDSPLCSLCRPNHESFCETNKKKKQQGLGPTIRNMMPAHRAGHEIPPTTPPPAPLQSPVKSIPDYILPEDLTKEVQEVVEQLKARFPEIADKVVGSAPNKLVFGTPGQPQISNATCEEMGRLWNCTPEEARSRLMAIAVLDDKLLNGESSSTETVPYSEAFNEQEFSGDSPVVPEQQQDPESYSPTDGSPIGDGGTAGDQLVGGGYGGDTGGSSGDDSAETVIAPPEPLGSAEEEKQ